MKIFSSGAAMTKSVELVYSRWGGGADPEMTHVFVYGVGYEECQRVGLPTSLQCVTDDFGNLVRVQ